MRILVAEDDPQNLYLARFLLERRGHEVVPAADGEQALAAAKESVPDLVLMDMLLPRMDGYEATRLLRVEFGDLFPVIALTAYSMKGDREAILRAGCNGYIAKPIDPNRFVEQVESFVRKDGE